MPGPEQNVFNIRHRGTKGRGLLLCPLMHCHGLPARKDAEICETQEGWCAINDQLCGHRDNSSAVSKTSIIIILSMDTKAQLHLAGVLEDAREIKQLRLLRWKLLLRPEQKRSSVPATSSAAARSQPQ